MASVGTKAVCAGFRSSSRIGNGVSPVQVSRHAPMRLVSCCIWNRPTVSETGDDGNLASLTAAPRCCTLDSAGQPFHASAVVFHFSCGDASLVIPASLEVVSSLDTAGARFGLGHYKAVPFGVISATLYDRARMAALCCGVNHFGLRPRWVSGAYSKFHPFDRSVRTSANAGDGGWVSDWVVPEYVIFALDLLGAADQFACSMVFRIDPVPAVLAVSVHHCSTFADLRHCAPRSVRINSNAIIGRR